MPFSEAFNSTNHNTSDVKLAVLEEKVFSMVEVISKLDDTIEKLSDLSVNVSKMLAVHEEKLEFARESAAETARELQAIEAKIDAVREAHGKRFGHIEKKLWIAFGILVTLTYIMQTPWISGIIHPYADDAPKRAKIEEVRRYPPR